MRPPRNPIAGFLTCFMQGVSFIHRRTRYSYKVQQEMCSLAEQRNGAPSILILSWTIPDEPPRWKVLVEPWKMLGFLASRGEEFNPGPEVRLDRSELLCNRVLLKYKRDRESFWHRHQKGQKEYPIASVSNGVIYFLITYYSESKECLEVVKTLLDPLP